VSSIAEPVSADVEFAFGGRMPMLRNVFSPHIRRQPDLRDHPRETEDSLLAAMFPKPQRPFWTDDLNRRLDHGVIGTVCASRDAE